MEFYIQWNFLLLAYLTDCRMLPDKHNLIMAKAMGLIFSLLDITSAQEVPFGIPQYVQCILHGLNSILLCAPFIFADSEKCQFGMMASFI